MVNFNWSSFSTPGDTSSYINQLYQILEDVVPAIRISLSSTSFRSFCDKFISSMIPRFTNSIFRCKKINEIATQQVL